MNLPISAKPLAAKIQHWDDERDIGNSLIVSLNAGFRFNHDTSNPDATHVMGFDNIKDACAGVRASIVCNCAECGFEEKPKRGGKRIGAGAPKKNIVATNRTFKLNDAHWLKFKALGGAKWLRVQLDNAN